MRSQKLLTLPSWRRWLPCFFVIAIIAPNGQAQTALKTRLTPFSNFSRLFPDSEESSERTNIYSVEQSVFLDDIPSDANRVRLWVSIPDDAKNQTLLDFEVKSCPGEWNLTQDAERRGRFLFANVDAPIGSTLEVKVAYRVKRSPEFNQIDPTKVGELNDSLKRLLSEHLVLDSPNMTVTPEFQKIADEVCGSASNIEVQAKLLLKHVASTVDHYSYTHDLKMPTCGIGNASVCKQQGGGCCTDLNSYFITLARARGIPARLNMGFRLQQKDSGKTVDVGYRCWVEYFIPHYGWISADVVEADTPGGLGHERWLSGLTSRRIWLNQGREFLLAPDLASGRVNNMTIGYAEIDGKPVRLLPEGSLPPQLTRRIRFTEIPYD